MRKAIIEQVTGEVVNVIEIEEGANWQPPEDCYLIDADNVSPGNTWDGTKFIPKPEVAPLPDPDVELATAIGAATTLAELKAALIGKIVKVKAR